MTLTALWRIGLVVAGAGALQACQSTPPTSSIAQLYQRPAERSLVDGIRLYDSGEFERSEAALHKAIDANLADRRDVAVAYKYPRVHRLRVQPRHRMRARFHQRFQRRSRLPAQ